MDLQALIEAINKLLAAIGVDPLPETANEDNLVPLLEGVALAIGQVGHEPDGDENTDDGSQDDDLGQDDGSTDATGVNTAVKMSNMLRAIVSEALSPFETRLDLMSAKMGLEVQSAEDASKAQYMTFRNLLGKSGVSEATLLGKDALAMQVGWKPELLEGLSPTITMANVSRGAAGIVPTEPVADVDLANEKPTDDVVAERLKARGIDPKFMPKS